MKEELQLDAASGWFSGCRRAESPFFDARPDGSRPELIVIHGISLPPGEFGGPGIDELFAGTLNPDEHPYYAEIQGLRVSTHLLIRRTGELVQYVSLNARAWHAGESCHKGRERCNDFAVGVELEGTDELAYTDEQYAMLDQVLARLRKAYPGLESADVVGHSDIAPGRKTDPGPAFDWSRVNR